MKNYNLQANFQEMKKIMCMPPMIFSTRGLKLPSVDPTPCEQKKKPCGQKKKTCRHLDTKSPFKHALILYFVISLSKALIGPRVVASELRHGLPHASVEVAARRPAGALQEARGIGLASQARLELRHPRRDPGVNLMMGSKQGIQTL